MWLVIKHMNNFACLVNTTTTIGQAHYTALILSVEKQEPVLTFLNNFPDYFVTRILA